MKLYGYWRSSAAYRIRIALNLKGAACELVAVNLLGEEDKARYAAKNPTALVPTLELDDGACIRQSLAIVDYLERAYPSPRLIPEHPARRAEALAFACDIGMEIHPLNNLRVLRRLKQQHGFSEAGAVEWMHHWMHASFIHLEKLVDAAGPFCFGDAPCIADVFLIPQLYNAARWGLELSAYPNLIRVNNAALMQPAFRDAHPDKQSDASVD